MNNFSEFKKSISLNCLVEQFRYKFTSAQLSSLKSLVSLFVLLEMNVDYYSNMEMSLMTIDNNFFIQVSEILLVTSQTPIRDNFCHTFIFFLWHIYFIKSRNAHHTMFLAFCLCWKLFYLKTN